MAERLVAVPLFTNAPVSGLAAGSVILSSAINLTMDVRSAQSIVFQTSSVASTADIGFFLAIGPDAQTFGSHSEQTALLTSTKSFANSTGWFAVSLPTILAPYIKIAASGTASNPTDTRVTALLILRTT